MVEYVKLEDSIPISKIKMYRFSKYSFSSIEIKHLVFACFMIILTLFAFREKSMFFSFDNLFSIKFLIFFVIYFFTVGLGFILHELGHKLVAQYYNFISEFRADFQMLIIMFLISLFSPFILLAPGAVMIHGRLTIRQNGIISVAGPVVNLVLAIIFILLGFIFGNSGLLGYIIQLGIWVNAFLGIFNMLPIRFLNLDGYKVLAWSKPVYFFVMGFLILILIKFGFGKF